MFTRALARSMLPVLAMADRRLPSASAIAAAQSRILRQLLAQFCALPVGRHFQLDRLPAGSQQLEAFRASMPVTTYGDYAPLIDRVAAGEPDILFRGATLALAQTSGTTSAGQAGERYIPQNKALLAHHARGGAAALARIGRAIGPDLLTGQLLMLGGSTTLKMNQHGIPAGDLSGITAARIPPWLRPWYEPGLDIALERDWERKLDRIAERCAPMDLRMVSGIPSWMMMLFQRVCQARGVDRVAQVWPGLRGFVHGGHAITPFLPSLREHVAPETWMLEVYPASEAFIAIGCRPWRLDGEPAELAVLTEHGIVVEFSPPDSQQIVGAEQLEAGGLYRVLVTTPAGLIRYQIGDLVQGQGPGRIRFAGRLKTRISVFGEHVEGLHLDQALSAASAATGARVAAYHVSPLLPSPQRPAGAHEWWVEFEHPPADLARFAAALDAHLRAQVVDYDAHRLGGQLLAAQVRAVPAGTFHRYLAAHGKLGGQHKVPQAWSDRGIALALEQASQAAAAQQGLVHAVR